MVSTAINPATQFHVGGDVLTAQFAATVAAHGEGFRMKSEFPTGACCRLLERPVLAMAFS